MTEQEYCIMFQEQDGNIGGGDMTLPLSWAQARQAIKNMWKDCPYLYAIWAEPIKAKSSDVKRYTDEQGFECIEFTLKHKDGKWKDKEAQHFLEMARICLNRARHTKHKWYFNHAVNWMIAYQHRLQLVFKLEDLSKYRRVAWWNPATSKGGQSIPLKKETAQAWVEQSNKKYPTINHYLQSV